MEERAELAALAELAELVVVVGLLQNSVAPQLPLWDPVSPAFVGVLDGAVASVVTWALLLELAVSAHLDRRKTARAGHCLVH